MGLGEGGGNRNKHGVVKSGKTIVKKSKSAFHRENRDEDEREGRTERREVDEEGETNKV